MTDIPIPDKYPASMMVAMGVLLDGMRKELKNNPTMTGAEMLTILEKTENIVKMITDMFTSKESK